MNPLIFTQYLVVIPEYTPVWLQDGDVIEMEIECLGRIKNKVVLENTSHSLFGLKKNM